MLSLARFTSLFLLLSLQFLHSTQATAGYADVLYPESTDVGTMSLQDVSADGKYIIFSSRQGYIEGVPSELRSGIDSIYLRNTIDKTVTKITLTPEGTNTSYGESGNARLVNNEYVIFTSNAQDLVEDGSTNMGVYLYNISTKEISLLPLPELTDRWSSIVVEGSANGLYVYVQISGGKNFYQFDIETKALVKRDATYSGDQRNLVDVSNDGRFLLRSNSYYGPHSLWVVGLDDSVQEIVSTDSSIGRASISDSGQFVTYVDREQQSINVMDINSEELLTKTITEFPIGLKKLTGNGGDISENGRYVTVEATTIGFYLESTSYSNNNNISIYIFDMETPKALKANVLVDSQKTDSGKQATFVGSTNQLYFINQYSSAVNKIAKLDFTESMFTHASDIAGAEITSESPLTTDLSLATTDPLIHINRKNNQTGESDYFLSSKVTFEDHKNGLEVGSFTYELEACSINWVCDKSQIITSNVEVLDFSASPNLNLELSVEEEPSFKSAIKVSAELLENADVIEFKQMDGRIQELSQNVYPISASSGKDVVLVSRYCIKNYDRTKTCGSFSRPQITYVPKTLNKIQVLALPDFSGVSVSWKKLQGYSYKLYRGIEGEHQLLSEGTTSDFIDTNIQYGQVASYKLVQCLNKICTQTYSNFTYDRARTPFSLRVNTNKSVIGVSFEKGYAFDNIKLYRSISGVLDSEEFIAEFDASATTYIDRIVSRDIRYVYRAEACYKSLCEYERIANSYGHEYYNTHIFPTTPKNLKAEITHFMGATLSWDKVAGADGYTINVTSSTGLSLSSSSAKKITAKGNNNTEIFYRLNDSLIGYDLNYTVSSFTYDNQTGEEIEIYSIPSQPATLSTTDSINRLNLLPVFAFNAETRGHKVNLTWVNDDAYDYFNIYKREKGTTDLGLVRGGINSHSLSVDESVESDTIFEYFIEGCSNITQTCSETSHPREVTVYRDVVVTSENGPPTLIWDKKGFLRIIPNVVNIKHADYFRVQLFKNGDTYAYKNFRSSLGQEEFEWVPLGISSSDEIEILTSYCAQDVCSEASETASFILPENARIVPSLSRIGSFNVNIVDGAVNSSFEVRFKTEGPEIAGEVRIFKSTNGKKLQLIQVEKSINTTFPDGEYTFAETNLSTGDSVRYQVQLCNSAGCSKLSNSVHEYIQDDKDTPVPNVPAITQVSNEVIRNKLKIEFEEQRFATKYYLYYEDEDGNEDIAYRIESSPYVLQLYEFDTEYTFELKACNDSNCSEKSASISQKTLPRLSLEQSISGQQLRGLSASSSSNSSNWVRQSSVSVKAVQGQLDAVQGELSLSDWISIDKGVRTSTQAFLSTENLNVCSTMLSHDLQIPTYSNWAESYDKALFKFIYTGSGCEEQPELDIYSFYIDSDYLDAPILIENKETWLDQWLNLSINVDELGAVTFYLDETEIFTSEQLVNMDVFSLSYFRWMASPNSWLSGMKVKSSSVEVRQLGDRVLNPSSKLYFRNIHPRVIGVHNSSGFNAELIPIVDGVSGDKFTLSIEGKNGGSSVTSYLADLRPDTTYQWLVRLCDQDLCGPFRLYQESTSIYQSLKSGYPPSAWPSHKEGELDVSVNFHRSTDEYFLYGRKVDEETPTLLFETSYSEPITALNGDNYSKVRWLVDKYKPGDEVYFSVKKCNPIECYTTPEDNPIIVPIDTDQDGVIDKYDRFPNDPFEWYDYDSDGKGDNFDDDDDGDGIPDTIEIEIGMKPLDRYDARGDIDGDGVSNLAEYLVGTNLLDPEDSPKNHGVYASFEYLETTPLIINSNIALRNNNKIDGSDVLYRQFSPSDSEDLVIKISGQMKKGRLGFAREIFRTGTTNIQINGRVASSDEIKVTSLGDGWFYYSLDVEAGYAYVELTFGDGVRSNNEYAGVHLDALFIPMVKPFVAGDYDGDGRAEIAMRNPLNYYNYWKELSEGEFNEQEFGDQRDDIPVNGDFDGDGKADWAIRRRSNQTWYVKQSTDGEVTSKHFGKQAGDIPVAADYDGDGKTDFAIRRPSNSTWYILQSSDGKLIQKRFGLQRTDIPVPADYDGDGKADIAIRRPSNGTWYVLGSLNNKVEVTRFGVQANDIPVPADYDGDGKDDIAVRRASDRNWYILQSSDQQIRKIRFGVQAEDIPVVSDYDGDGKADIAVRRSSSYMWYILMSSTGEVHAEEFGRSAVLVPNLAPLYTRLSMTRNVSATTQSQDYVPIEDGYEERLEYQNSSSTSSPEFKGKETVEAAVNF